MLATYIMLSPYPQGEIIVMQFDWNNNVYEVVYEVIGAKIRAAYL